LESFIKIWCDAGVVLPEDEIPAQDGMMNLRVAMLGNVDSGKSTLSGILTSAPGSLDDGRGSMRSKVFNFAHE